MGVFVAAKGFLGPSNPFTAKASKSRGGTCGVHIARAGLFAAIYKVFLGGATCTAFVEGLEPRDFASKLCSRVVMASVDVLPIIGGRTRDVLIFRRFATLRMHYKPHGVAEKQTPWAQTFDKGCTFVRHYLYILSTGGSTSWCCSKFCALFLCFYS